MSQRPEIRLLIKLLLFCVALVATDLALGTILKTVYFRQSKGQIAQTTYSVDSASQDIIVFGSSRAVRHYSPSIITKGTNYTCYNVGRDAERMPYYAAIQELVLKRTTPKLIILDLNSTELRIDNSKYTKLSILLPYCDRHPELIKYIREIGETEPYKLLSKCYPYNSLLFIMFYNFFFESRLPKDDHGFQPLNRKLSKPQLDDIIKRRTLHEEKSDKTKDSLIDDKVVEYYRFFLDNTLKKNIKTWVIVSPCLLKDKDTYIKSRLISIAKEYPNVSFMDYSNDTRFNYNNLKFSDMYHLNKEGASEFSQELNNLLINN